MRQKIAALFLGACSVLYLFAARSFETGFIADPIGPRAFPYAIGTLLLASSLALVFTREKEPTARLDSSSRLRALALGTSLALYALVLEPLGFVAATTLEMAALVVLFRGRFLHGLLGGLLLSVGFFLLFAYLLSVPLPLGLGLEGR